MINNPKKLILLTLGVLIFEMIICLHSLYNGYFLYIYLAYGYIGALFYFLNLITKKSKNMKILNFCIIVNYVISILLQFQHYVDRYDIFLYIGILLYLCSIFYGKKLIHHNQLLFGIIFAICILNNIQHLSFGIRDMRLSSIPLSLCNIYLISMLGYMRLYAENLKQRRCNNNE